MEPQQDTRDRILEWTWRLLKEDGPARVRMVDVARAAGVSRQSVYLHFGSRAGLLLNLAAWVDERNELGVLVEWVAAASNGRELVQRVTRLQVLYNPRIDALAAALQLAAPTDPDMVAAFRDRREDRLEGMRRVVERLVAWDALRADLSPDRAAELAWSILSLGVWRDLVTEKGWSPEEYCEHISATLEAALMSARDP